MSGNYQVLCRTTHKRETPIHQPRFNGFFYLQQSVAINPQHRARGLLHRAKVYAGTSNDSTSLVAELDAHRVGVLVQKLERGLRDRCDLRQSKPNARDCLRSYEW